MKREMRTIGVLLGLMWMLGHGVSVRGEGVEIGMGAEAVRAALGAPNGMRDLADGQVWVYADGGYLRFKDGVLVSFRGVPGVEHAAPPVAFTAPVPDEPVPQVIAPEPAARPTAPRPTAPQPTAPQPQASGVAAATERAAAERAQADALEPTIAEFSEDMDVKATEALAAMGYDVAVEDAAAPPPQAAGWQGLLKRFLVPTILQFFFLLLGFKLAGAEGSRWAILLIAAVDRLVIEGVRWTFLGLVQLPMTFHAEHLASVIVMIALVQTLTHAKQLPTIIKVIATAKIAAVVSAYLLFLFVLHTW